MMDFKDIITIVYYCLSVSFQGLAFFIGILYLWYIDNRQREKDRADEKLRKERDEKRRVEEQKLQQLLEGRKLLQELNSKYFDIKSDKVIQRLQHAKASSEDRISPDVSGFDVMLYMINDEDSFPDFRTEHRSVTTSVGKLRFDIKKVLSVLNYCWSLCLLGNIWETLAKEMREIVIELGNLALPFCIDKSDKQHFDMIEKCLRKFVNNPEIPEPKDTRKLTEKIPYVEFLQYEPYGKAGKMFTFKPDEQFKSELHYTLEESTNADNYAPEFARKLKEKRNGWIRVGATDEEMVVKLIHDVRYLTWKKTKNPPLNREEQELLNALEAVNVCKEITASRRSQDVAKQCITRFQQDLSWFTKGGYKDFEYLKEILNRLQHQLAEFEKAKLVNGE